MSTPTPTSSCRSRTANPVTLLDAVERHAHGLEGVEVHQMHALRDRPMLHGEFGDKLRHVSYFLSHITRPRFPRRSGGARAQPLLRGLRPDEATGTAPLVIASASPPDRHGNFSLGCQRRLRRQLHRAGPVLPRGERADAAHDGPQPDPRVAGDRVVRGRLPAARGVPDRADGDGQGDRRSGRRGACATGRRSRRESGRSRTPFWPI